MPTTSYALNSDINQSATSINDFVSAVIKEEPIFAEENSDSLFNNGDNSVTVNGVKYIKSAEQCIKHPVQYYLFDQDDLKVLDIDENTFETSDLLLDDNSLQPSLTNLSCPVCGKILLHKKSLRQHIKNHEKTSQYSCQICNAILKKTETFEAHMKRHKGIDPFGCEICGITFSTRGNMNTHQAIHINGKSSRKRQKTICDVCGKSLEARAYIPHMRVHTGEKPFECHICKSRFNFESNLRRHIRMHENIKNYACDICGKKLRLKKQFNEHMSLHTGEIKFTCDVCNEKFSTHKRLRVHQKSHSSSSNFECSICCSSFQYLSELKLHNRSIHHNEAALPVKSFLCDFCGKRLHTRSAIQVHMRNHSGEKPYACSFCNKKFASSTYLMFHMRIHDGYKPYKCTHCCKSFAHKHVLTNHIRTHTGEKPFGCHLCDKFFSQNSTLTSHLKSHSFTLDKSQKKPTRKKICKSVEVNSSGLVEIS